MHLSQENHTVNDLQKAD